LRLDPIQTGAQAANRSNQPGEPTMKIVTTIAFVLLTASSLAGCSTGSVDDAETLARSRLASLT
jgi:hypothetical protein